MAQTSLGQALQSQDLHVVKIEHNPGLLPVKQGKAFLQQDQWAIVKTIDLKGIERDLTFNVNKYSELLKMIRNNEKNNSHRFEFIELSNQVQYLRDETIEKLQQLLPLKRAKRGLLNPLGSIIKVITGNLDHDDAIRYDKLINGVKTREQAISNKMTIVSEMMDHFLNSTKAVNENTELMNERLKRIDNKLSEITQKGFQLTHITYLITVLNMFIENFRTIYIKLNEIETALALSKVSVLHKSVLSPDELLKLLIDIDKHNNLMYTVNEQNVFNLEETLTVKTYLTEKMIRFIIDIPLVENVTYTYYKLYPLPMSNEAHNQTVLIIPEFPYVLVDGNRYRPAAHACREVTSEEYLCSEEDLVAYAEETCVEQLMTYRRNPSLCSPRPVDVGNLKVQKISKGNWILYLKADATVLQTSGNEVIRERLRGTFILTVTEGNEVSIDGIKIRGPRDYSLIPEYKPVPVINLPEISSGTQQSSTAADVVPVNLKRVDLDDIQHLNYMLKKSVKSGSESGIGSVGFATIALYVIVLSLIIVYIVFKFNYVIINRCKKRETQENDVEAESPSTSQEGPVKDIPLILIRK